MRQVITQFHKTDAQGRPTGGSTQGAGIKIEWQDGPLGREPERHQPNGAFVEGVIAAVIGRLEFYQNAGGKLAPDPNNPTRPIVVPNTGVFACKENAEALEHLQRALAALDQRTASREARGVEGTHTV